MPLYDYKCGSCGHFFEESRRIDNRLDPESLPCPKCNEMSVKLTIIQPFLFGDPIRIGVKKLPTDWNEFVKRIKTKNKDSNVNWTNN